MHSRNSSSSSSNPSPWKPSRENGRVFYLEMGQKPAATHFSSETSCYPPTRDGNSVLLPDAFAGRATLPRCFHKGPGATRIRRPGAELECGEDSVAGVRASA